MKRIALALAILMVCAGNAWAQEVKYQRLQDADIKEVSVEFVSSISTESARSGDDFEAILNRAILDPQGRVLAPDGAKIYGVVVVSENWDSNFDHNSQLGLSIIGVEDKNGESITAVSEVLYLTRKKPTKKSVLWRSITGALSFGFLGALGGKYGAVAGAGFGAGANMVAQLRERSYYRPIPVKVNRGRVLWFKLLKD